MIMINLAPPLRGQAAHAGCSHSKLVGRLCGACYTASMRRSRRRWARGNPGADRAAKTAWNTSERGRAFFRDRQLQKTRERIVDSELFESVLAYQGGVCAICGTPEPSGRGWHLDHDHDTNQFRGVLCSSCNTGLGHMEKMLRLGGPVYLSDTPVSRLKRETPCSA